jgi:hypothetical protein
MSTPLSRPSAARAVFGDRAASAEVHRTIPTEQYNLDMQGRLTLTKKSIAFGGLQGCCMAAAALGISRSMHRSGGGLDSAVDRRNVLLMLAAAVPSAFSLGYAICSAYSCERDFMQRERLREEWELENFPQGEKQEMIELYVLRGMSEPDATQVVEIMSKSSDLLVDMMMVEELGFSRIPIPTLTQTILGGGVPATLSAVVCTLSPLLPLVLALGRSKEKNLGLGEGVLAVQVCGVSIMQGRLLYGEYWKTDHGTTKLVVMNTLWVGVVYVMSRALSM